MTDENCYEWNCGNCLPAKNQDTLFPQDSGSNCRYCGKHYTREQIVDALCFDSYPSYQVKEKVNSMGQALKSTNHIEFIGDYEYFTDPKCNLYKARSSNALDVNGFRLGGRWEAPPHMVDTFMEAARAEVSKEQVNSITETNEIKITPAQEKELLPGAVANYREYGNKILATKAFHADYTGYGLGYALKSIQAMYGGPLFSDAPYIADNPQVEQIETLRDLQRQMLDILDGLKECRDEIERGGNNGIAARLNTYVIAHIECSVTSEHGWLDSSTSIDSIIEELEEE